VATFTRASHVPLFDRLCAPESPSSSALLLQGADLKASLAHDLERLLNTRNGLTVGEAIGCEAPALRYGIPDLLGMDLQPGGGLQLLADLVQRAIAVFEPRLREVSVQALPDDRHPDRARLVIGGAVMVGRQLQRVDFDIALDEGGTTRTVAE
jgi:type VI secretion system protein ImpF